MLSSIFVMQLPSGFLPFPTKHLTPGKANRVEPMYPNPLKTWSIDATLLSDVIVIFANGNDSPN